MAVAAVRDWQLLVAAPYARLAAEAGLVGFACANYNSLVAPPGGRTAGVRHQPARLRAARRAPSARGPGHRDDGGRDAEGPRRGREGRADARGPHLRPRRPAHHRPGGVLRGRLAGAARQPARAAQGLRPRAVRRRAERRPERGGLRAGRGRRRAGQLPLGARRGGVPAARGVPGADGRADRPGQATANARPASTSSSSPGERGDRRHAELTARGAIPLEPAGWQMLASGCEALGVPLPESSEG